MNSFQFLPAFVTSGSSNENRRKNFQNKLNDIAKNVFAFSSFSDVTNFSSSSSGTPSISPKRRWKGGMKKSMFLPLGVLVIFLLFGVFMISNALRGSNNANTTVLSGSTKNKIDIEKPKAEQEINKTYEFSIKDAAGADVSKLKFNIQNAEIRDEIVVKGQRATSVEGRTFLIINMKITNSFNKNVQINSRNYLRLTVNNSDELLAPDIHNDPVEIQAISTKYTRVGFPINDTDKNLQLQVGEITGKKETIKLNLK